MDIPSIASSVAQLDDTGLGDRKTSESGQAKAVPRPGPLAAAAGKWRAATREFEQLFGLASSWPERMQLARFLMKLYSVRALPWRSYHWDTSIRL